MSKLFAVIFVLSLIAPQVRAQTPATPSQSKPANATKPSPIRAAGRRRRPSVVAARRLLRNLSAQLWTPTTTASATCAASPPSSTICSAGRRRHLDLALFPLAAGRFRLRRLRLRRHRPDVRHADRLRPAGERWRRSARHPHHSRLCGQPHFRPAHVVSGFELLAHLAYATGTSGATARARSQPPNNWISLFGGSAWNATPRPTSTTTTFSIRSSRT